MVQNDHDSELSGFLMGSAMGKGGKGGTGPSSGGGTVLPMLLPGSSNTQDPAMDASAKVSEMWMNQGGVADCLHPQRSTPFLCIEKMILSIPANVALCVWCTTHRSLHLPSLLTPSPRS
eukprot:scaffold276507_cov35-Tisochrysis_lutea.AAC.4